MKWNQNKSPAAGYPATKSRWYLGRLASLIGITVMMAAIVFTLAGCGGSDPKALAKQSYDIGKQALGALFNPSKAAELEKKAAEIEKKVAKLSESDQAIYREELARLTGEALGGMFKAAGDAMNGLLDATGDALNSANIEDTKKALDATSNLLNSASGLLDSTSGLLDSASKLSDDPSVQDATDAAQKAADALKALGN